MAVSIFKRVLRREVRPRKDDKEPIDLISESDKYLDFLKNTTLDIAITGVAGAGKSSVTNALRGMSDTEEESAKAGETETTTERKRYPHPTFPKVTVWDLPGIGTPRFNAKKYLKDVCFEEYDFFIIICSDRFTENDILLALEIRKMNKKFYFIRNKIDQSMESGRRREKADFSEEECLKKIRNYCCNNLIKLGEPNQMVFLISTWYLHLYDFPLLQETLESDLDDLKRHALILAMPAFSKEALKKKKAAMEAIIDKVALVSCGIGAVPVPGLSVVCDTVMLVATMRHFFMVFGLDEGSLHRLANRIGKHVDVLRSAKRKTSAIREITIELVIDLLTKEVLRNKVMPSKLSFCLKPILGCLAGGGLSYSVTFYTLKNFLDDVEEDAENIVAKALES